GRPLLISEHDVSFPERREVVLREPERILDRHDGATHSPERVVDEPERRVLGLVERAVDDMLDATRDLASAASAVRAGEDERIEEDDIEVGAASRARKDDRVRGVGERRARDPRVDPSAAGAVELDRAAQETFRPVASKPPQLALLEEEMRRRVIERFEDRRGPARDGA